MRQHLHKFLKRCNGNRPIFLIRSRMSVSNSGANNNL